RIVYSTGTPTTRAVSLADHGELDYLPDGGNAGPLVSGGGPLDKRYGPGSAAARRGGERYLHGPTPGWGGVGLNAAPPLFRALRGGDGHGAAPPPCSVRRPPRPCSPPPPRRGLGPPCRPPPPPRRGEGPTTRRPWPSRRNALLLQERRLRWNRPASRSRVDPA